MGSATVYNPVTDQPCSSHFALTIKGMQVNTSYSLDCYLSQTLAELEGMAKRFADPGDLAGPGTLQMNLDAFAQQAQSWCAGLYGSDQSSDTSCSPANVAALVQSYQQKYLNYLKSNFVQDYFAGTTTLYFVQSGKTLYDYAVGSATPKADSTAVIPNALNNVAPTGTYIAPAQTTSVLNPPTGGMPITQQQIVNGQTVLPNTGMNVTNIGGSPASTTSWIEQNWPLLAVAAGGLIVLSMAKS